MMTIAMMMVMMMMMMMMIIIIVKVKKSTIKIITVAVILNANFGGRVTMVLNMTVSGSIDMMIGGTKVVAGTANNTSLNNVKVLAKLLSQLVPGIIIQLVNTLKQLQEKLLQKRPGYP